MMEHSSVSVTVATDSPNSRAALIRAASELMIERGVIDVTLSEIGERAQLSTALVKYYFGSRNGLMMALAHDVLGKGLLQLNGLIAMELDPITKLKLHIKAVINVYFRYPYVNRLIHALLLDQKLGEKVAKTISRPLAETQRQLVEEAVQAGVLRPIDPMLFYFIILGACDYLFFSEHVLRHAFNVPGIDDQLKSDYTDTLLDMVMNGLLVTKKTAG